MFTHLPKMCFNNHDMEAWKGESTAASDHQRQVTCSAAHPELVLEDFGGKDSAKKLYE